jgi:hypothetical protein
VGNPLRSDRADSNGSTRCPCRVFVGPTSNCLVALASVPLALVSLFLSKLTRLERWLSPALELTTAAVAMIEPVAISLSLMLNRYRLHGLHRRGVPPGQQVIFVGGCSMHLGLT